MSIQYLSQYFHNIKKTILLIYMINVFENLLCGWHISDWKIQNKINYGLAHLLFKVAEYQFFIYAKRTCLKESFSEAKK